MQTTIDRFPGIDNTVLASIIAVIGAISVKLVEKWASKKTTYYDEGERIRRELRQEIDELKDEIATLKQEANTWREKYWNAIERADTEETRIEELQTQIDRLHHIIKQHLPDIKV